MIAYVQKSPNNDETLRGPTVNAQNPSTKERPSIEIIAGITVTDSTGQEVREGEFSLERGRCHPN
jgi:hypothetical protein